MGQRRRGAERERQHDQNADRAGPIPGPHGPAFVNVAVAVTRGLNGA